MINVAAAIIRDAEDRILICRRSENGDCGGLWEFPGGKKEPAETMVECLIRECRKELNVQLY